MDKIFICRNEQCQFVSRPRRVSLVYLGQYLYLRAEVLCVCGQLAEEQA